MARRAVLASALVVTFMAGACGPGADAEPVGTVTPTAGAGTPTASASAAPAAAQPPGTAPVMPAQARQNTPRGAEAFTAHWFATMNWAHLSGDTQSLRLLSESDCAFCAEVYRGIEAERDLGASQEGGLVTVEDVVHRSDLVPGQPLLAMTYREAAGRVVMPDGSVRAEWSGVPAAGREAVLVWTDDQGWLLRGFGESVRCVDCS